MPICCKDRIDRAAYLRGKMKHILFSLISLTALSCIQTREADLVVHNAVIYTLDEGFTTAAAMAVKDGKILETGAEREILNRYRAAEKYDARKMYVYPGFIDAHAHFTGYARNKAELDLRGVTSAREMALRTAEFAKTSDRTWITGRGWDQNLWADREFPDRALLDSLLPDRPVLLRRIDGHAALINGAAARKAALKPDTNVPGGHVVTDAGGRLTGVLIDRAVDRVARFIPPVSRRQLIGLLKEAEQDCYAAGLTTVSDLGITVSEAELLDSLHKTGDLSMRIYASLGPDEATKAQMRKGPILTERLSVRSVKLYADGALGSRGALLKVPYTDDPDNYGLLLTPQDELEAWARDCRDFGFQLNTHCIGDSANALVLKIYARVLESMNDLRWRIEHAQVVSPEDRRYFGEYGIIPSVQPTHAVSDGPWAEDRLGPERIAGAYAYASLRESLGLLALGTDFPVEDISPLATFRAAVFRSLSVRTPSTSENSEEAPFRPEEALTAEEALRGMTIWAALACFEEDRRGSLEPGKAADFTVLDRDLKEADRAGAALAKVKSVWTDGVRRH